MATEQKSQSPKAEAGAVDSLDVKGKSPKGQVTNDAQLLPGTYDVREEVRQGRQVNEGDKALAVILVLQDVFVRNNLYGLNDDDIATLRAALV